MGGSDQRLSLRRRNQQREQANANHQTRTTMPTVRSIVAAFSMMGAGASAADQHRFGKLGVMRHRREGRFWLTPYTAG